MIIVVLFKMNFFILILLMIYQTQFSCGAQMNPEQKECTISPRSKVRSKYIAKEAFINHRVDVKHPKNSTLITSDAQKYYEDIFSSINFDNVVDFITPFESFCLNYNDSSRKSHDKLRTDATSECYKQLKSYFPYGLDKKEMVEWIYFNRVYADIRREHIYATNYMKFIQNGINVNSHNFKKPATFCIGLYHKNPNSKKKQSFTGGESSNSKAAQTNL